MQYLFSPFFSPYKMLKVASKFNSFRTVFNGKVRYGNRPKHLRRIETEQNSRHWLWTGNHDTMHLLSGNMRRGDVTFLPHCFAWPYQFLADCALSLSTQICFGYSDEKNCTWWQYISLFAHSFPSVLNLGTKTYLYCCCVFPLLNNRRDRMQSSIVLVDSW